MSSDHDIVLRVQNISKCFEMYDKPVHRLFQMLMMGRKTFYQEFWALKDINLEVKRGECVGIIGKNGAGKSTLLQIITGTLQPTAGTVETKGRIAALLELGSGFNPEFSGRDNVYMNASILGLTKVETDAKYDDILAFADIGDFISQPVKTYSSGMMVRLAFAVIVHVNADILIIDEALSVGDVFFGQKCMRFLREFMKHHTVIFVSHDTGAVTNLCKRAILLESGKIKMEGAPKEVAIQYLKDLYAVEQCVNGASFEAPSGEMIELPQRDMRLDFINHSNLRNDVEVFTFSSENSFGAGGARIEDARFTDQAGNVLNWVVGGEIVRIIISGIGLRDLTDPIIVGFTVRDRLGQDIFVDNTFLTYMEHPVLLLKEHKFHAEFIFTMPILRPGDYSVSVAIAEGTQEKHVQHHWINDAIVFRSHSSYAPMGLMALSIFKMNLHTSEQGKYE